jgi:hypothetical protein
MRHRWPRFSLRCLGSEAIGWVGPLRGFQREYEVLVQWNLATTLPPTVFILSPKLTTRPSVAFADGLPLSDGPVSLLVHDGSRCQCGCLRRG